MKTREFFYIVFAAWCVAMPCFVWRFNTIDKQETVRLRLQVRQEAIRAMHESTTAINRASDLAERIR